MSLTQNRAVRCDQCGRLSRHHLGEYARPNGSVGYINSKGRDSDLDSCDECESSLTHCPNCGSTDLLMVTPMVPGPDGWGRRCKACRHQWSIDIIPAQAEGREA